MRKAEVRKNVTTVFSRPHGALPSRSHVNCLLFGGVVRPQPGSQRPRPSADPRRGKSAPSFGVLFDCLRHIVSRYDLCQPRVLFEGDAGPLGLKAEGDIGVGYITLNNA